MSSEEFSCQRVQSQTCLSYAECSRKSHVRKMYEILNKQVNFTQYIGTCKSAYTKGYALNWVLTRLWRINQEIIIYYMKLYQFDWCWLRCSCSIMLLQSFPAHGHRILDTRGYSSLEWMIIVVLIRRVIYWLYRI